MLAATKPPYGAKDGYFCKHPLAVSILLVLFFGKGITQAIAADDIQFNMDVLDLKERSQVDLSQFSQAGYIMPGVYTMAVQINTSTLPERQLTFLVPDNNPKGSAACLTSDIVSQLGLKPELAEKITWWHHNECMNPDSLPGMTILGDLGAGTLRITIPQIYLEYTAPNWDPPSRWDEGIPGVLFDYNLNAQENRDRQMGNGDSRSLSGNGVAGVNIGPWRLRADWQGQYNNEAEQRSRHWEWNRYYMYRAIKSLRAQFMLGENYLNSGMFDSFRYTGASLVSDDSMLPPNLRGYAPEVTGVAKTNAKVTVSQEGRVLYETTVAAGPFRIQDLNNAVNGTLDVKIQEQDGTVQTFQMDTATIPYLTRPGTIRFKMATGAPTDYKHHSVGGGFATGEFSMGVSNGWSVFGGMLTAGDYNSLAAGIGRDLLAFGAISFDVTQSYAKLSDSETKQGGSYRLSYSKRFDATDSRVTFAGYRFSERNFMSMSQYLNARYGNGYAAGSSKEYYTLSFNQQITALNLTAYLSYGHQTYWDRPANDTYNLSVSSYFDVGSMKNVSLSLSAYRSMRDGENDDGMYLSLSVPWGNTGSLSYSSQFSQSGNSNSVGYSDILGESSNYNVRSSFGPGNRNGVNGYLSHTASVADFNVTASYENQGSSSVGMSMSGGMTATAKGAALHRTGSQGGTRMMVDTDGVGGVPVRSYGSPVYTNSFGKAVVGDVNSYYRNSIEVDLNKLDDNVEATRSVVEGTLTAGAIGYRKFGILAGQKAMSVIRMADGSFPPFGALITNADGVQTAIVAEDGNAWLSGIKPNESMRVNWDGETQCSFTLPAKIPAGNLLLPCKTRSLNSA